MRARALKSGLRVFAFGRKPRADINKKTIMHTITNDADDIIDSLIENEELFEPLKACGLTVAVLSFTPKNEGGKLMLRGCPCKAVVRKTNEKERAMGVKDAVIIIDQGVWDDLEDRQREAVIAHELYHLIPQQDGGEWKDDGTGTGTEKFYPFFKFDAHKRPILAMRPHDIEFGWFVAIATKYGTDSTEVEQAREIVSAHGQLLFDFASPPPKKRAKANAEKGGE